MPTDNSANNQFSPVNPTTMSSDAPPPPTQVSEATPPVAQTQPSSTFGAVPPQTPPTAPSPTTGGFGAQPPQQPPAFEQGTPTVNASNGEGKKKVFIIAGVILLLLVLGVGAYFVASNFLFPAQEEPTPTPVAEEEVTALCLNIKAYDVDWNRLSLSDLSSLEPGNVVRFTVSGDTSSGNFDMARFSVNSISLGETSQINPDTQEFYDEYIIPEDVESFSVEAQLHHQQLDQWI